MVVIIATASSFMNSSAYIHMASSKLGVTPRTIDMHGMIKYTSSSWGLQKKASNLLKTQMMLDREQKGTTVGGSGRMSQDDVIFRQKFCIRSYEVGPNGTASVETIMNHLQETSGNHMQRIGLRHDGIESEEMIKKNLTWVMVKLQLIMDRYPTWGDIVQINTWKTAYGNTGVRCNSTCCDCKTGEIIGRASSVWVMMNKKTRKLSKFPNDFRAKFEQCFLDTPAIVQQDTRTWSKRHENIEEHICNGLSPRWSDLDINQHVNNVKYIGWMFQSVPKTILENYEIESMTLQYYRECTLDSVVQSFTSILTNNNGKIAINGDGVDCQHLLKFEIGGDILKGTTKWRPKNMKSYYPST